MASLLPPRLCARPGCSPGCAPPQRRRQRHGAWLEALSVALPSGLLDCLGVALAAPPRDWCALGNAVTTSQSIFVIGMRQLS